MCSIIHTFFVSSQEDQNSNYNNGGNKYHWYHSYNWNNCQNIHCTAHVISIIAIPAIIIIDLDGSAVSVGAGGVGIPSTFDLIVEVLDTPWHSARKGVQFYMNHASSCESCTYIIPIGIWIYVVVLFPASLLPNITPLTPQTSTPDTLSGNLKVACPFFISSTVKLNMNVPIVSMMIMNTERHRVCKSSKYTWVWSSTKFLKVSCSTWLHLLQWQSHFSLLLAMLLRGM